jgi:uncharacterized membrane protein YphA (DoxX/SURF4 family)
MDVLRFSLAAILLATGVFKLVGSRKALLATGQMEWVTEMPMTRVRGIAILELLAVAGLIAPPALGVAEFLTRVAALGVVALMIGGALMHARLGEQAKLPLNAALALAALLVAVAS